MDSGDHCDSYSAVSGKPADEVRGARITAARLRPRRLSAEARGPWRTHAPELSLIARTGCPISGVSAARRAGQRNRTERQSIAPIRRQRPLALDPSDGAQLEALVKKTYATPKPIIDRIAKLIQ